jgi:hypothetical protein
MDVASFVPEPLTAYLSVRIEKRLGRGDRAALGLTKMMADLLDCMRES